MSEFKPLDKDIVANSMVDAKQFHSPIPLLHLKKELATISSGDTLQIDCADSGSRNDIISWCERQGHAFLGEKSMGGYTSYYITKK